MKKVAIELAKLTAYVTTIVLVMCVLLTIFANKANAQALVPVDMNGNPLPKVIAKAVPIEETILMIESWNQIDETTVDSRGLYSVKFTEDCKKYALDFITKKEYQALCKRLEKKRKADIKMLMED
jgi:orotate phosphoribosyltransferase-like protein